MKKIKKAPIVFEPYLKTVIWGGDKIRTYKGISSTEPKIGESWEISVVPNYESIVRAGHYKGKNLKQLVDLFGEELLGKNVMDKYGKRFPLLIKFIDAAENLSVQVHPNDKLAGERHGGSGKTEMWYIIEAEKEAKIYSGLNRKMTPEEYEKRVENGTFAETLVTHNSNPGDVFYIPSGRVHAIGAGNLLVEIQDSSDITYRIYDYDRKDANGKSRELHTDLAKEAIDYEVYDDYKIPVTTEEDGIAELVNCEHFKTKRIKIAGTREFEIDNASFVVLICIDGEVTITGEDGETMLSAGHTALIPASAERIRLKGEGTLISSRI